MSKSRTVSCLLALCVLLLSGCTTSIPHSMTYSGKISPISVISGGYVESKVSIFDKNGAPFSAGYDTSTIAALNDALKKHLIPTSPTGEKYTLTVSIKMDPEYELWSAKPYRGRNFAKSLIPFVGAFNERYYSVRSGFTADFVLEHGKDIVSHKTINMKEARDLSFPAPKEVVASRTAGIRLWEELRDKAIGKFFEQLSSAYPSKT